MAVDLLPSWGSTMDIYYLDRFGYYSGHLYPFLLLYRRGECIGKVGLIVVCPKLADINELM